MKKYLNLLVTYFKLNISEAIIYRGHFFILLGALVVGTVMDVLFFNFIYSKVESIGGWNFYQVVILIGFSGLVYDFIFAVFISSIVKFKEDVRTGNFDFFLTKPISALFHVSIQRLQPFDVTWFRGGLIVWGLVKLNYMPNWLDVLISFGLLLLGVIIAYCLYMLIAITTLYTIKASSLEGIYWQALTFMRLPSTVYPRLLALIFTFITPIILLAAAPTQVILGMLTPANIITSVSVASLFLLLVYFYWRMAIRHYSSASS